MILHGYMVVRLTVEHLSIIKDQSPNGKVVLYRGFDRLPWEDVEIAYYKNVLPTGLRHLYKSMEIANDDFSGLKFALRLDEAREFLDFSRQQAPVNEIVAIRSYYLNRQLSDELEGHPINWIGLDIAALGSFSLLAEGVFKLPALFPITRGLLNNFGLVNSEESAELVLNEYLSVCEADNRVEPPPLDTYFTLEIGTLS